MFLCRPKVGILEKGNPKVPSFQDGERLIVTANFANPNVKVIFTPTASTKVAVPSADPSGNGGEAPDLKEIRMERQNIIDAVVVRVMKARKTEKHLQLMEDTIKQITIFMPDPTMIK